MPDVATVFADRAIGREVPAAGYVGDRHSSPALAVPIGGIDAILAIDVTTIVGKQHVVVALEERVDEPAEKLPVTAAEVPCRDEVDRGLELAVRFVKGARKVAACLERVHLVLGMAEEKEILC